MFKSFKIHNYLNSLILFFGILIQIISISGLPQPEKINLTECQNNSTIKIMEIVPGKKLLGFSTVPHNYKEMDFTLRGSIYFRTAEIQKELESGVTKPFKKITRANIADLQSVGQKPITFLRQMVALASYPELSSSMPSDVVAKVRRILEDCTAGSVGSYASPKGLTIVRKHVAEFLTKRDGGIQSNFEDVILTNGVTEGVLTVMKLFQNECTEKESGIMVPVPLYPLYSAVLTKYGIRQINYYLDESNQWELDISELERAYSEARCNCNCIPRAILLINPGNPSGKVFRREKMEAIIKFAYSRNLVLLADQIFQENIYGKDLQFISFKKVMMELGNPYDTMELISFNSVSKGYMGESGLRGGYFEFINSDPRMQNIIFQLVSVMQCPNLLGQVALDCLVNPPKEGDPSFELFEKEKNAIIGDLERVSSKLAAELTKLQGFECSTIEGGIVAFTKITLPQKAVEMAIANGQKPDELYGLELLDNTGISVAVGSAFGLRSSQYYLRLTIPTSMEQLDGLLAGLRAFHVQFMKKYTSN